MLMRNKKLLLNEVMELSGDTTAIHNNKSEHQNQQHFIKEAMLCQ